MKAVAIHSHLNGLEFLLVHKPNLWSEVQGVIASVDAGQRRTTISDEKWTQEELPYSPLAMKRQFASLLKNRGWMNCSISNNVPRNVGLLRESFAAPPADQEKATEAVGEIPIYSNRQADFVKDRVAIEVQFGKHASLANDLFVKHPAFYVSDQIDVGIEILPMKSLQSEMSSGIAYYEGEFYNVIRQGRGVPAMPLVLIGIEP